MQIVIPMSGFGERFRQAGYKIPKPLIKVDGKPIIQYVVEMFPNESNITFICNRDHLQNPEYQMKEILEGVAPKGKIISIDPHKLGPVHAVLQVVSQLNPTEQIIVNYADFTCDWDYADFCKTIMLSQCDGAIPCYRGFHPHTLWSNYYAYVPEKDMNAIDIQEKKPFTDSPRDEFASSGTYYFKNVAIMQHYFERCISEDLTVAGEYYASMSYKPMIQDGLKVQVYELNHFMQWGTPSDLEEYCYWSNTFSSIMNEKNPPNHDGALILPMVGKGSRFQVEGYDNPKPLISVSEKPMAIQAIHDLPKTERKKFILRSDIKRIDILQSALMEEFSMAEFTTLDYMTDGQASTCVEGADGLSKDKPVTIAACDNGMIYDSSLFNKLMELDDIDVIVWTVRGYPGAIRSPEMYGWVDSDDSGNIIEVSVKKPLSDPTTDPIIVGTFTFKRLEYYLKSVERMKQRNAKINGEYYVDMAINDAISMGLKCCIFEIDYFICWGTPNDLKTFEYWQSCFDGWASHPYSIEKDRNFFKN